jgi:hypothetical protein
MTPVHVVGSLRSCRNVEPIVEVNLGVAPDAVKRRLERVDDCLLVVAVGSENNGSDAEHPVLHDKARVVAGEADERRHGRAKVCVPETVAEALVEGIVRIEHASSIIRVLADDSRAFLIRMVGAW